MQKKKERLLEVYGDDSFTRGQTLTLLWVVLVLLLNAFQILAIFLVNGLTLVYAQSRTFMDFYLIFVYFWFEMVVWCNGVTLLRLF